MSRRTPLFAAFAVLVLVVPVTSGLVGVESKITPPAASHSGLGSSMAVDGEWAVVSASNADGALWDVVGEVHVLHEGSDGWDAVVVVSPDDERPRHHFGFSVALEGDVMVVGAPGDDEAASQAGAAYVFRRHGNAWLQEAKLVEPRVRAFLGTGVGVAGNTVVLGAPGWNGFDGGVLVYEWNGTSWGRAAVLAAPDSTYDGQLGRSIAFDGRRIVAGAPGADGVGAGTGAAFVFERQGAGWSGTRLFAGDGILNDHFGTSVAVDGRTIVVGSVLDDDGAWDGGAAYVFRQHGPRWDEAAKLVPAGMGDFEHAGGAVAVSWPWVAVGSARNREGGGNSGAVYLFSAEDWSRDYKLRSDGGPDQFGSSLSLDRERLLVGAPTDNGHQERSGSVFRFRMDCGPEVFASYAWQVPAEECDEWPLGLGGLIGLAEGVGVVARASHGSVP